MTVPPLHGTKTHKLSVHAYDALARLAKGPLPTQEFNPGVVNRLVRGSLATVESQPSPYVSARGKNCEWLTITEAGRKAQAGNA